MRKKNIVGFSAEEQIVIPAPIADYSSPRVLTMEFIPGKKITELSPLTKLDFDGAAVRSDQPHDNHDWQ